MNSSTASPVRPLPADAASPVGSTASGIALFIAASLCFAGINTLVKLASRGLHVLEVSWGRYAFSLLFLGFLLPRLPAKRPLASSRPALQVGRAALLIAVTLMLFVAITYIPLVDAIAIGQTTPLMVTALAGPLLGERAGAARWAAVAIGFFGVLVIIRPGLGTVHWASVVVLAAAVFNALYYISTRALASIDRPETTVIYTAIIGAAVLTLTLPFVWSRPDMGQLAELLALGALGFASQYLMTLAYMRAPASTLAPYTYLIIVWLAVLGYLVFGEVPDPWTAIGALVVVASGLYLYRHEARSRRAQTAGAVDMAG
jgi:drug/metabolite transporter (DMT)-like permease